MKLSLLSQRLVALLSPLFIMVPSIVAETKPNVVFMFCDDLGYGDVSCLNPEAVASLLAQLKKDVFAGRSTEGVAAKNHRDEIHLWKSG